MDETKNKGGRPKKDPSRLLSETLQVKVTNNEVDLLIRYCQAHGIERADYLRKAIFGKINAWAKSQPDLMPVASSDSVAEKAPKTPVDTPKPEIQALPALPTEKAPETPKTEAIEQAKQTTKLKRLEKPDYGMKNHLEEQPPAPERPRVQITQIIRPGKQS